LLIGGSEEEIDWMGQDCWFCNQRPPVKGKSSPVRLKKFADGGPTSVRVLKCSVSVPRCAECAAGHERASAKAIRLGCLGAVAVFLVVVVWNPIEMAWWVKALLVFFGFVPGMSMLGGTSGLPAGQKPESQAEGFMAVGRFKRDGWMKDDKP
jgi:hypothetical protein